MKKLFFLCPLFGMFACSQKDDKLQILQNRIDTLAQKIADSYKPGFGEFMSSIQIHHDKLWFAAQHHNWKLADFEIHEMIEAIEDIRKYETDRKESRLIGMINPALDSVNASIQQRNLTMFNNSYVFLTNTCNSCHHAVQFEFNVVKIPDSPPFSNQDFGIQTGK